MNLSTNCIMLTGGAGFLGSFVAEKLKAMPVPHKRYAHQAAKSRGSKDVFIPAEQEYDTTKLLAAQHLTLPALAPRAVKVIKILRTVPYAQSPMPSPLCPLSPMPICAQIRPHPVHNPGLFPEEINPEDFFTGDEHSILRNPLIAETLYKSKDIERWGSGIKRIHDECAENHVKVVVPEKFDRIAWRSSHRLAAQPPSRPSVLKITFPNSVVTDTIKISIGV